MFGKGAKSWQPSPRDKSPIFHRKSRIFSRSQGRRKFLKTRMSRRKRLRLCSFNDLLGLHLLKIAAGFLVTIAELVVANSADYVVSTYEIEPGKWQGEIRRRDGGEMQVDGPRKVVFTTALAQSSGQAMMLAYKAIDTNKILPAGWT